MIEKEKTKNEVDKTKTAAPVEIKYFDEAVIKCSCGAVHKVGSTKESGNVEICSACHPFYTGTQKFIDSAGRLEKFKARIKASQDIKNKSQNKK